MRWYELTKEAFKNLQNSAVSKISGNTHTQTHKLTILTLRLCVNNDTIWYLVIQSTLVVDVSSSQPQAYPGHQGTLNSVEKHCNGDNNIALEPHLVL